MNSRRPSKQNKEKHNQTIEPFHRRAKTSYLFSNDEISLNEASTGIQVYSGETQLGSVNGSIL